MSSSYPDENTPAEDVFRHEAPPLRPSGGSDGSPPGPDADAADEAAEAAEASRQRILRRTSTRRASTGDILLLAAAAATARPQLPSPPISPPTAASAASAAAAGLVEPSPAVLSPVAIPPTGAPPTSSGAVQEPTSGTGTAIVRWRRVDGSLVSSQARPAEACVSQESCLAADLVHVVSPAPGRSQQTQPAQPADLAIDSRRHGAVAGVGTPALAPAALCSPIGEGDGKHGARVSFLLVEAPGTGEGFLVSPWAGGSGSNAVWIEPDDGTDTGGSLPLCAPSATAPGASGSNNSAENAQAQSISLQHHGESRSAEPRHEGPVYLVTCHVDLSRPLLLPAGLHRAGLPLAAQVQPGPPPRL